MGSALRATDTRPTPNQSHTVGNASGPVCRRAASFNRALKAELSRLWGERGWREALGFVAVANLKAWSWRPARGLVLGGVRREELEAGIPIIADFDGSLTAPPWRLPERASSVLVLDERGAVRFVASGPLGTAERERLYALLDEVASRGAEASAGGRG